MRPVAAIHLPQSFNRFRLREDGEQRSVVLDGLSQLNIFVGRNNSGKSYLLRSLSAETSFELSYSDKDFETLSTAIEELRLAWFQFIRAHRIQYTHTNFKRAARLATHVRPDEVGQVFSDQRNLIVRERSLAATHEARYRDAVRPLLAHFDEVIALFEDYKVAATSGRLRTVYIPTLRGLRRLTRFRCVDGTERDETNAGDLFGANVKRDNFANGGQPAVIFTGQDMYQIVRSHLLGALPKRELIRRFERFLSDAFFEGEAVTLLPREDSHSLYVKVGDAEERPIYELGDGIQALITIVFAPFTEEPGTLFFVEEPEQHLHPGMQRLLLRTLAGFDQHQFFISTQSNHLLDITADYSGISVYSVDRAGEEQFSVNQVSSGDLGTLRALGVLNSSVFLVNATIWVEGITDRWYLRKWLELFQAALPEEERVFQEDIHFSFVEFGGNNITHFSFLDSETAPIAVERVCGTAMLIHDHDNGKEKRFATLRERLGDRFVQLPVREVENLLTPRVVRSVLEGYGEDTSNLLDDSNYANRQLGEFIQSTLNETKRRGGYADEYGRLKDKRGFCTRALEVLDDRDLSDDVRSLCRTIYDFVATQNPA